jgi:hypothetical protein
VKRLGNVAYWLVDGGFGMLVYGLLAVLFAVGTVAEVASNGLTGLAGVEAFLTIAVFVAIFNRD